MASVIAVLAGLLALAGGAELLVGGAIGLATRWRVSPLLVGLVLVAWGTSAPELAASAVASASGADALAVGNVSGSNLFNVGAVLAACALLAPLHVDRVLAVRDAPLMLLASVGVALAALDGVIGRVEGGVLLLALGAHTAWVVRAARREGGGAPAGDDAAPVRWPMTRVVGGLVFLGGGARLLVTGSVALADAAGVDPRLVAVTVVAAGTSLPELFASMAATRRGHLDVAVANVVGSNLFNLLGVLGVSALVAPTGLHVRPWVGGVDLMLATLLAAVLLPVLWTGLRVSRAEGLGLGASYLGYLGWLAWSA
ncbi:MAG: sodium:calcium antiporter [Alphaproteobacteria bacterium]|nr:sodium:calcium antiporter [Alphaproteobacteria bacterium]